MALGAAALAEFSPAVTAYRTGQRYLFQSVPVAMASSLGGSAYSYEHWGPTYQYVDFMSGWKWANAGGDYLDANLTAQGPTAWAQATLNLGSGSAASAEYTNINVTALVQHVQTKNRWLAIIVRASNGNTFPRVVAGPLTPGGYNPPRIDVTYADGSTAVLACRIVAAVTSSSVMPASTNQAGGFTLPAYMEFERPAKAVASAALRYTVTQHWSGSGTPIFGVYLLNPPVNAAPVTGLAGLAVQSGVLDSGITSVAGVIGAHRYVDGTALSDFSAPLGAFSDSSESSFDPAIYGTGAQDLTKLPHAYLGKWIPSQDANLWSVVPSGYAGDGFAPLAPGLGALRVEMPNTGAFTGQEQRNGGTVAAARKIMMPAAEYGLLDRIFVRYYVRFGTPYDPTVTDRKEILRFGNPTWSSMAGKWGVTPSHDTTYGGVSGTAGGGYGWTLRHRWADCEVQRGGPNEGGITGGWHLYDYGTNNPVGHRYMSDPLQAEGWGQGGGLGGTIYAGRWYLIEQEVKLNSVNQPSPAGDGKFWTPDGELRVWVDGRLTYERAGMVFRSLPLYSPAPNPTYLRPVRELGVASLWFNWYHGGLENSTYRRVMFVTGLVWAKQRIGAMRLA